MIAYLQGKILQKTTHYIVLENAGIGYKVFTTPEVLELPIGHEAKLYLYHKSGDDGQILLGMSDFASLQFFEMLITVTGVGPKMALTIVSATKIELLQQAIMNADVDIFTRMSGVGKKTAERIILELRNKVNIGDLLEWSNANGSEIYDALVGLGYNPREIRDTISQLDATADTTTQLKHALKLLSRS